VTRRDDEVSVLRLAMLTEDRTDREQKAMLRVADRLDFEHNRATVMNERAQEAEGWQPSFLYDEVQATRVVDDESQKHVELDAKRRKGVWPRKGTENTP
jgi:hypothetical protein